MFEQQLQRGDPAGRGDRAWRRARRAAAIVLPLLLASLLPARFAPPASAQDVARTWQVGGPAAVVAVESELVFVGVGTRLHVFRDQGTRAPRLLARGEAAALPITAITVEPGGRRVWVAGGFGPLRRYDVAADGALTDTSTPDVQPPGYVRGMALDGDRLWLAAGRSGVAVVAQEDDTYRIAEVGQPEVLDWERVGLALKFGKPSWNTVLRAHGRIFALAGPDHEDGQFSPNPEDWILLIPGWATPTPRPTRTPGPQPTPRPPTQHGLLMAVERREVEVGGGSFITFTDGLAFPGSGLDGAVSADGTIWSTGPGNALHALDVATTGAPRLRGRLRESDDDPSGMYGVPSALVPVGVTAGDGRADIVDRRGRIVTVDITDPDAPRITSEHRVPEPKAVASRDASVWSAANSELLALGRLGDGSLSPTSRIAVSPGAPVAPQALAAAGGTLWVADQATIYAVDPGAAEGPVVVGTWSHPRVGPVAALFGRGDVLYGVDLRGIAFALNVTRPGRPKLLGTASLGIQEDLLPVAVGVIDADDTHFALKWRQGSKLLLSEQWILSVLPLAPGGGFHPNAESLGRRLRTDGRGFGGIAVRNSIVYVGTGSPGLLRVGIEADRLTYLDPLLAATNVRDVASFGALIVLLDSAAGLLVVEPGDEGSLRQIGRLEWPPWFGMPIGVHVTEGRAWLSFQTQSPEPGSVVHTVREVDLRVPSLPDFSGRRQRVPVGRNFLQPNQLHVALASVGDRLAIAGRDIGLLVHEPVVAAEEPPPRPTALPTASATPTPTATATSTGTPTATPEPPRTIVLPWLLRDGV